MKNELTYEDIYDTKLMKEDGLDVDETIKRIMEVDTASVNGAVIKVPDAEWRLKIDQKYRICPECGKHSKKWMVNKYKTTEGEIHGLFTIKCLDCTMHELINSVSNDTGMC